MCDAITYASDLLDAMLDNKPKAETVRELTMALHDVDLSLGVVSEVDEPNDFAITLADHDWTRVELDSTEEEPILILSDDTYDNYEEPEEESQQLPSV